MALTEKQQERCNKLHKLGLKFEGDAYVYGGVNFHWTDIVCMTDEEFDRAFEGAEKRMKVIKEREAGI
jgi:hypothetical protein